MAELIRIYISKHISQLKLIESNCWMNSIELPKNVHRYTKSTTNYLSYLPFDQQCQPNCIGDPNWCPKQQIKKNLTITEFVKKIFPSPILFLFESIQVSLNLGGIQGKEIVDAFHRLDEIIQGNPFPDSIIIATTCNCHGVIDCLKWEKK